jgi:hypothetical protein
MNKNAVKYVALMTLCASLLALSGCSKKYGDKFEIDPGEMFHFHHKGDPSETIQVKIDLRHVSGPPVKLYVMDDENWKRSQIAGPSPGVMYSFIKVEYAYELSANNSRQQTDWVDIPIRGDVYFVIDQVPLAASQSKGEAKIYVKKNDKRL